ncbi:MAG: VOC family protein [Chloroflexi bacterium]|nr:VOC family protein [Chloroflexota bacterium]MCL5110903.1 VOC family protein [Chloroflexota bacterium]
MFKGVHHVGYYVSDLDEAIKWYRDLYGGVVELRYRNEGSKQEQAFVKSGNTRVELMCPDDKSKLGGNTGQVLAHIGYEVDDIQAGMAELRAKGVRFIDEKPVVNPLGWQLAYYDGGATVGVKQHLTQHK